MIKRNMVDLGFGVEADFDGEHIILRSGVEDEIGDNVTWLDPAALRALVAYAVRVGALPATVGHAT